MKLGEDQETPDGLELSWLDGRTTTLTPNVEQLLPACNQVILDGVYKRSPDERPSLVFSQDGTFVDTGILSRIDEDYVAEDSFPKGVGVYQINNHSLILKYNHGYMTQLSSRLKNPASGVLKRSTLIHSRWKKLL